MRKNDLRSLILLAIMINALAFSFGCTGFNESGLGNQRAGIFNGALDGDQHPWVVIVKAWYFMDGAISMKRCSASVIGKRTLLTAGHCLPYEKKVFLYDIQTERDGEKIELVRQSAIKNHPDGYTTNDPELDLALISLKEELEEAETFLLADSPPTIGEPITMVGYGTTEVNRSISIEYPTERFTGNEEEQRYSGKNVIAEIQENTFSSGSYDYQCLDKTAPASANLSCSNAVTLIGDSGGPALVHRGDKDIIAGVTSQLQDDNESILGYFMRVDLFKDWIQKIVSDEATKDDSVRWESDNLPTLLGNNQ